MELRREGPTFPSRLANRCQSFDISYCIVDTTGNKINPTHGEDALFKNRLHAMLFCVPGFYFDLDTATALHNSGYIRGALEPVADESLIAIGGASWRRPNKAKSGRLERIDNEVN